MTNLLTRLTIIFVSAMTPLRSIKSDGTRHDNMSP